MVTDLDREGLPFGVTLVIASETSSGEELIERCAPKAAQEHHGLRRHDRLQDGSGDAPREARAHLAAMLDKLQGAGLLASGMTGDPDPYTAAVNALELFRVDDVITVHAAPISARDGCERTCSKRVRHVTSAT